MLTPLVMRNRVNSEMFNIMQMVRETGLEPVHLLIGDRT